MSEILCDVEAEKLREDVHHAISVLVGIRNRLCCPECGSDDYYCNSMFDRCDIVYDDGHEIEGILDYADSEWRCGDCGYCEEA